MGLNIEMPEAPYITNSKYPLLVLLVSVAVVAAVIPNIGQQLYDQGFSFSVIDVLNVGSYLVFAVAVIGAWRILKDSRVKWLLLVLIPVAYCQPLLWAFAQLSWSIGGFAP